MEIVNKGMTIVMTACCILCSCSDEPLMSEEADSIAASPVSLQSRGLDAVSGQTAWRDIRGFDPSLPGQAVEVELPVSCGGAETSVTARLSIMPMHVYEENGPDRLGDYYVVEADFTAHNGPMWEKGMFMKSLDVKVTPTDKQGNSIPGIAFHDNPTPATTVANQTFTASATPGVYGAGLIGVTFKNEETQKLIQYDNNVKNQFFRDLSDWLKYTVKISHTVDGHEFFTEETRYGKLYVRADVFESPREVSTKDMLCGEVKIEGVDTPVLYYDGKLYRASDLKTLENRGGHSFCLDISNPIGEESVKVLGECDFIGYGDPINGRGVCLTVEDVHGTAEKGEYLSTSVHKVPDKMFFGIGASGGYSWGKEQSIRLEDVTTSLRTDTDCAVEYLYTVENYDSGRGIPEAARSDFHSHATWVWRMPVAESGLTPEQLVSSLYDIHIEATPLYATAKNPGRNLSVDKSATTCEAPLEPPLRLKECRLIVTNSSAAPVGDIKVLSVPYPVWKSHGKPESEVVAESDATIARGESVTLAVPEIECYVVETDIDPRTLRSGHTHMTQAIDIRIDGKKPHDVEVASCDMPLTVD